MPQRSQARREDRLPRPPITDILPNTASIVAAGAVGRTIATLTIVGGTAPVKYTLAANGGMSVAVNGNLLVTTVNPCGTAGSKAVQITATDARYLTKTETITVTVT